MTTSARRDQPPRTDDDPPSYCQVITQARFAGRQDVSVMGVAAGASSTDRPYVSIRIGRVLVYIEDRAALVAWTEAVRRALDLSPGVFEPAEDAFTAGEALVRRRFERASTRP